MDFPWNSATKSSRRSEPLKLPLSTIGRRWSWKPNSDSARASLALAAFPYMVLGILRNLVLRYTPAVPRRKPVKPIPPSKPQAHDEGARLVPLADEKQKAQDAEKLSHYMRLADLALARPTKEKE